MNLDLDRALVAPENRDAGNTGNSEQAQADRPVSDRAQIHQRARLRRETDYQHSASRRRERRHDGWLRPLRELLGGSGQPLRDDLPVAIDIARRIEEYCHDGQALDRRGTERLHARRAANGILNRTGDENLDLLGRQSNGLGLDADLGRRKLRKHVILGATKRIDAIGNQNAGERGDDTAEADCESDNRRLRAGGENGAHF